MSWTRRTTGVMHDTRCSSWKKEVFYLLEITPPNKAFNAIRGRSDGMPYPEKEQVPIQQHKLIDFKILGSKLHKSEKKSGKIRFRRLHAQKSSGGVKILLAG